MADHPTPHLDLGGYVLGSLASEEAEAFETHLADCATCRDEVGSLAGLPALLDRATPHVDVPVGLAARTRAAVDLASTSRRRRRLVVIGGVAAAVLAIAAAVLPIARRGDGADARKFALVAVGTVAPQASGRAVATLDIDRGGWVVDLTVEGLRPSAEGTYYECWYVGAGDSRAAPNRVSAGTFSVGPSGHARLQMTLGARLREYPVMTVSLETDDGEPARSGDDILRGETGTP